MKQQSLQEKAGEKNLDARLNENILNISTEATKLQREGTHNHYRAWEVEVEGVLPHDGLQMGLWGQVPQVQDRRSLLLVQIQISDGNEQEENIDTVAESVEPARTILNLILT